MSLTDQQLRQELIKYGESVPPITQRNRQLLRDRLDILRSRPRSPARPRPNASSNTSVASRSPTRSRPVPGLIELSDSETDTPSSDYLKLHSGNTGSNIQTRSIPVRRPVEPTSPASSSNITNDVEQSSKLFYFIIRITN
jgi:hypothetical protein